MPKLGCVTRIYSDSLPALRLMEAISMSPSRRCATGLPWMISASPFVFILTGVFVFDLMYLETSRRTSSASSVHQSHRI